MPHELVNAGYRQREAKSSTAMRITRLTLSNFRCFGPEAVAIDLVALTTFVGSNACGKTALLAALTRLFGVSPGDRGIRKSDFHVPAGTAPENLDELKLWIEARIEFPELADGEDGAGFAVSDCFRQMVVDAPMETPYCRVRLEASWARSSLPEGDVEESIFWVSTAEEEVKDDKKFRMSASERSRIHVLYVPAARDPVRQLRQASGTLLHRLLGAIRWTDGVRKKVEKASRESNKAFREEPGVNSIEETIKKNWTALHDFTALRNVHLRPLNPQFEDVLRQIELVFSPGEGDAEQPAERLSDGLRSLFYLTLIASVFDAEDQAVREADEPDSPLRGEDLEAPNLSVLAIEEPENHLAPHYLGRILKLLVTIAESPRAQVVLTSHSPSILGRIDPVAVRHLRLDIKTHQTIVRSITLPEEEDEAHKYVREAVKAYPELYFARMVILCEGDSEEIILPRFCALADVPIDPSFVSVVPLGGRHVNHFWRLLTDLSIPYVTLLDLDRERETGGWARVKYVLDQLIAVGRPKKALLGITKPDGTNSTLSDADFQKMGGWKVNDVKAMNGWVRFLEGETVFFSQPLDIDFAMLAAFPGAYHAATDGTGPRLPNQTKEAKKYQARLDAARLAVLKSEDATGETYTNDEKVAFVWYSYLFLGRGKPSTHILALNTIETDDLWKNAPKSLKELIERVRDTLNTDAEEADSESIDF
jgi:hypothetical protein